MLDEFKVQWFDHPTNSWRRFGLSESDAKVAKEKAQKLHERTQGQISVRVRYEKTYYELPKGGK